MSIEINERLIGTDKDGFLINEQLTALFSNSSTTTACRYAVLPKPISGACV